MNLLVHLSKKRQLILFNYLGKKVSFGRLWLIISNDVFILYVAIATHPPTHTHSLASSVRINAKTTVHYSPDSSMVVTNLRSPVAEFIDSWLGDKVNSGIVLSYRHDRRHGCWASTTTLCPSRLYPPVMDLRIRLLITTSSYFSMATRPGRGDNGQVEEILTIFSYEQIWRARELSRLDLCHVLAVSWIQLTVCRSFAAFDGRSGIFFSSFQDEQNQPPGQQSKKSSRSHFSIYYHLSDFNPSPLHGP